MIKTNEYIFELTVEDFARSFATTVEDIPDDCRELIYNTDFRYRIIEGIERDKLILEVLKKIETDKQIIGAPERQTAWEKGWKENLQDFISSGYDLNKLVPKCIRPNQVIRLNQNYIMPSNPNFELYYFSVLRLWLFTKYLRDFEDIYEFGCGTAHNLVALAELYPGKKLHGLDWTTASCDLVNKVAEVYKYNITGHLFDMFSPDTNLDIPRSSAFLTICTLEQTGYKYKPFLQFIQEKSPALCINVEPICELYDEDNLIDNLALKFHKKRNYLDGYLSSLYQLQDEGRIKLLKIHRTFFGSLFHEAYSYVVWKPQQSDGG